MSSARIRFGTEDVERPSEIPLCRQALADCLQIPAVSFREKVSGSRVLFELSGPGKRAAEATDRGYTVLPMLQSDGIYFWVAMVLVYAFEMGDLDLRTSSIVLFQGLAEGPKAPLLRAEWEKLPAPRPHAQPHWHVYPAAYARSEGLGSGFALLHLAMAARWHDADGGNEPHYTDLSGDAVVRWARGCIIYLREEFSFLAKRRPA